jgi:hypothetical protein
MLSGVKMMDSQYPNILSDDEFTAKTELRATLIRKQERRASGLSGDDDFLLAETNRTLQQHHTSVARKAADELYAEKQAAAMAKTLTFGELQELHLRFSAKFAEELKALETWGDLDPQIATIARARAALLSRMFESFTDVYYTAGVKFDECTRAAGDPVRMADKLANDYEKHSIIDSIQRRRG